MLKHIIRITLRNIARSKLYAFINILGLSLGIACAILIILFISEELRYDRFHADSDRLYRVYYEAERMDGSLARSPMVPMIMGDELRSNYPEIVYKSVWYPFNSDVRLGEEWVQEMIHMVDSSFLRMFSFDVLSGNADQTLQNPGGIVITRSTAEKYFGDEPVVGKTLEISMGPAPRIFVVEAVVEDPPTYSSLRFNFLVSSLLATEILPEDMLTSWMMVTSESYVQLNANTDVDQLTSNFERLVESALGPDLEGRKFMIGLQPMIDIHMDTSMPQGLAPLSDPKYTYILMAICLLILSMAAINFMNLSLGRSFGRAREIGVKKSIGAERRQLMAQFLGESVMLSLISLLIGVLMACFALPLFNTLSGKQLVFSLSMENIMLFTGLAILIGILSGIYPAVIMSGFRPVETLKGKILTKGGRGWIREGMVVVQLILSVFLITTVLFMKEQLNFIQNKNLGFNRDQLVVLPLSVPEARGLMDELKIGGEKAERGKVYLASVPAVEGVCITSQSFGDVSWMEGSYLDESRQTHSFHFNVVDEAYIPSLEIELIRGRNFRDDPADQRRAVIVNEAFARDFGLDEAVGMRIPHPEFPDHEIIGVVKDFNYASLHFRIEPLVLTMNPELILEGINGLNINASVTPRLMVRLRAGQISEGMNQLEAAWKKVYSEDSFLPSFVDETIQAQYQREGNLNTIVVSATIISVLIAALGLFGLATLTMNARKKEMGIRKVLGAGVSDMLFNLSRSYLLLLLAAFVLSIPLTYWVVSGWLSEFEFKVSLSPFVFTFGGLILSMISVLILTFQAMRIIKADPVHAIRTE